MKSTRCLYLGVKINDILYTGNYLPMFYFRPFLPCCQQANLRLGELQFLKLSLFKHNCVWANLSRDKTV